MEFPQQFALRPGLVCIAPGLIDTGWIMQNVASPFDADAIPLRRVGTPDDYTSEERDMSNNGNDEFSNPLSRKTPLGGRTGVAIVSIVPFVALILFLIFGWTTNGWGWAWIFFLAVPIAGVLVYGLGGRDGR